MSIGQCIFRLRMERCWSQKRLANMAGVSQGIIASIEQGRRSDPHVSTLTRVARAFEVPLTDLLVDYEPPPLPVKDDEARLAELLDAMERNRQQ